MFTSRSVRSFLAIMVCILMVVSLFPVSALSEGDGAEEHVHDYVPAVTDPTCTEDGYTEYTCSGCDDTYVGDPVPASGHSWDGGEVTVPATTGSEGVLTYTCNVCGATETKPIPVLGEVLTENPELETLELEIPNTDTPEYPMFWVRAVDRDSKPLKDVTLELVLPSGDSAGWFLTDENGLASCSLDETGDNTLAYIRRHKDDKSGYGPASPVAVSIDRRSLVSISNQTETGFGPESPFVMTVYPDSYTVTLYPNGGAFDAEYESFEILAKEFEAVEPFIKDENEPCGYFPTDRFETYRPSEDFEDEVYVTPVLEGYMISGWYTEAEGGDRIEFDEHGDGTRLYTPEASIYAHWEAIDYSIVLDSDIANGSVTASSSAANIRDTVTLTAVPGSVRYELASLSVRLGEQELPLTAGENNTWTFTMPAGDVTVSASFKEITVDSSVVLVWADEENKDGIRPVEMPLTLLADGEVLKSDVAVTAENGWTQTVSGLPKFSQAEQEILYVWAEQPTRGYTVLAETSDGVTTLTNTLMPQYAFTVDTDGNGSVLVTMGEAEISSAYAGDSVTLIFTANEGYEADTVNVKQGEADVELTAQEDGSALFTMPSGDVTITAAFRPIVYTVTVSETENGFVSADRTDVTVGETVTLTVSPAEGYELDVLSVRQGEAEVEITTAEDGTCTFTVPAGDVTVSAQFKATVYTVTVNETENGTVTADKAEAVMGEPVALTVLPEIGYTLGSLSVKDSADAEITVTENAFTMPAGNVAVSADFKEVTPVFMTHSLLLGGELGINFFMDLPEFDGVDYTDSYMTFTVNDETLQDSFDRNFTDLSGSGYYGFTCTVNALQMADEITAVFHYKVAGEEKTVSQVYTVETYLNALLESDEISDTVKNLARALADYGYYSQNFLSEIGATGTNHNDMATRFTDSYSAEQLAAILDALADQQVHRESNRNIEKITYSLYLDSKTSIYLYLQTAKDYNGAIGVSLNGGQVSAVLTEDSRYRITIPDLSADELDHMHQVVIITDGADPLTVQVSVLSYIKACLEDENSSDDMIDAMAALYGYYAASTAQQAS